MKRSTASAYGALGFQQHRQDLTAAVAVSILGPSPKLRTLDGFGGRTPWTKLYPVGAGVSPDWCLRARGTTYDLRASSSVTRRLKMSKIIERCAGIDIGKGFSALLCPDGRG